MFVIISLKHSHKSFSLLKQSENSWWHENVAYTLHTQRLNTRSGTKAAVVYERHVRKQHNPCLPWTGTNGSWPQSIDKIFYSAFERRFDGHSQNHQKLVTLWNMTKLKYNSPMSTTFFFYSIFKRRLKGQHRKHSICNIMLLRN